MTNKKKIIWFIAAAIIVGAGIFAGEYFVDYWKFQKVAEAVGAMPWQDGGTVTAYQPGCTQTCNGKCCCVYCDLNCVGGDQILLSAQNGTQFICTSLDFVYQGGGTVPRPGGYIIAGGVSNIVPWVIGISP